MEADSSDVDAGADHDHDHDHGEELTEEKARDLLDVSGLEGLEPLADKLQPRPLKPIAVAGLAEAIDELAGGSTATYVNTSGDGVVRIAVLTDDSTLRLLMLTSSWKWRGPYTPDDPEGWLNERGYVPAPEIPDQDQDDGEAHTEPHTEADGEAHGEAGGEPDGE